jgi:Ca2+-binding EF-hand superfamily protein
MKTRTKVAIAASAAIMLAGIGVTGVSLADSGGWHGSGGHYKAGYSDSERGYGHGKHQGRHSGGRHMFKMFETFDTNGDGSLTQAEIDEARAAQLAKFDRDGSGGLSLAEYEALWLEAMRSRMVDRFQDFDDDGDGIVTKDEYSKPFARMVRFADMNDDGAISKDDMMRHHKRRDRDDD